MTEESTQTGKVVTALSPASDKKPFETPVLTKPGALRDITPTNSNYKGRRDGRKDRNIGRGGMNGRSREAYF
jgi:hypothetical protein